MRKKLFTIVFMSILISACEDTDLLPGSNSNVERLEGEWLVNEESEIYKSTAENYSVTISIDPDNENGVIIVNFYNIGSMEVRAEIAGNSVSIPNQDGGNGFSVYGSGDITSGGKEIELNYIVNDGSSQDDHVTARYTKVE